MNQSSASHAVSAPDPSSHEWSLDWSLGSSDMLLSPLRLGDAPHAIETLDGLFVALRDRVEPGLDRAADQINARAAAGVGAAVQLDLDINLDRQSCA